MADQTAVSGNKPAVEVVEDRMENRIDDGEVYKPAALAGDGLVKSPLDELPILKDLWLFRVSILYAFFAFTSSILDGFAISMSGSIINNAGFKKQFGVRHPNGTYVINTSWISAWTAVLNVGQIVAAWYIPYLCDRWGHKIGFYSSWVCFASGLTCLTVAKTPPVWFVGKLFLGMGIGTNQLVTTPYVMEIAPNRTRGTIVIAGVIWTSVGGIMNNLAMQRLNAIYPDSYTLIPKILWAFVGFLLVVFLVLPESPWVYALRDDQEACLKSLKRLYNGVPGSNPEEEYGVILRTLKHEKMLQEASNSASWQDFLEGTNRIRFLTMLLLCCGGQFGGLTLIGTYSTYLFATAGFADPFLASLIQSCVSLLAVIIYVLLVGKVGRRWPMDISYTLMGLSCWLLGALYYSHPKATHPVMVNTILKPLVFVVCINALGFPTFSNGHFLMVSELPTARLRIKFGSIAWALQACLGITTSFAVPPLLARINLRAGFVFGVTSLICGLFFWFFLPETKGRAVAKIDEMFEKRVPAWNWSSYVTDAEIQLREAMEMERHTYMDA